MNNSPIKITVVTVCYNSGATLEKTIKSVLNQGYSNLEYIIIDGASNDNTMEVIEKYKDSIDIIVSEEDSGIYDAMNKGVDLASGELIAFLNSGDWYCKGVMDAVNDKYHETEADILFGDIILVYENRQEYNSYKGININDIVFRMPINHQGVFVSTELMKYYRFDQSYYIAADYKALLNMYYCGSKFEYIDREIAYFNCQGISSTNQVLCANEIKKISEEVARENGKYSEITKIQIDEWNGFRKFHIFMDSNIPMSEKMALKLNTSFLKRKYYVFGAGIRGQRVLKFLDLVGIEACGVIDNHIGNKTTIYGYKIVKPQMMAFEKSAIVIVTPKGAYEEIKQQLCDLGIKKDSIIDYFDFAAYMGEIIDLNM